MNLSRLRITATLALCSLLGACASNPNQAGLKLEQEQALQRWVDCIDRQTDFGTAAEALSRINVYCEGHKRDLLAVYPAHLKNDVNELLILRTQKIAAKQVALRAPEGAQLGVFSVTLK